MHGNDKALLIEHARRGNRQAVNQLLAICYPSLLQTAKALLGSVDDAQDATQEAAIAVFEKLHQLENPEAFRAWSSAIVRRACSNIIRQRQLICQRTVLYDESSMDHGNSRNDHLLEIRTQLAEIFDQAGEPTKAILMYRLVLGLSVRETASVLGLSEGAVKLRLFRARRKAVQFD